MARPAFSSPRQAAPTKQSWLSISGQAWTNQFKFGWSSSTAFEFTTLLAEIGVSREMQEKPVLLGRALVLAGFICICATAGHYSASQPSALESDGTASLAEG